MSVAEKLCRIMQKVGPLSKDGRTEGKHSYSYLSEDKQTSELHNLFADEVLSIHPFAMTIISDHSYESKNDVSWRHITIEASYQIIDKDDPVNPMIVQTIGEGRDTSDKAANKAMTAAYKYALKQTLMISTGDDPDHQSNNSDNRPPRNPQQSRKQQSQPGKVTNPASKLQGLKKAKFNNDEAAFIAFRSQFYPSDELTEQETIKLIQELYKLPNYQKPKQDPQDGGKS